MNKKDFKIITDTIDLLLQIRFDLLNKNIDESSRMLLEFHYYEDITTRGLANIQKSSTNKTIKIDKQIVDLYSLLTDTEKKEIIIDLAEHMKKIQEKKNITPKEFAEIYNISISSQKNYRSRLNDALPYHQKVAGGKIVYVVAEVERWFENQHK